MIKDIENSHTHKWKNWGLNFSHDIRPNNFDIIANWVKICWHKL